MVRYNFHIETLENNQTNLALKEDKYFKALDYRVAISKANCNGTDRRGASRRRTTHASPGGFCGGGGRQKAGGCFRQNDKTAWLMGHLISSLTVRFGRLAVKQEKWAGRRSSQADGLNKIKVVWKL